MAKMKDSNLSITVLEIDDIKIVALNGEIDSSTAGDLKDQLNDLILSSAGRPRLVLDCEKLNFINSSGISLLLVCQRNVEKRRGQMALCGMSEKIHDIFATLKLDKVLLFYKSAGDALKALQSVRP